MIQKALPAVAYIRMSTDKQEDSPARQRGEIERYAAQHGYSIQHWYEDHGQTGTTSSKRKGFQKLLEDAKSRRFQYVLLYEQSRFTREDMLTTFKHLWELREFGVKLVTTLKGVVETDEIAGMLMTLVEAHKSRAESETIAHRTVSGKRRRVFERGLGTVTHIFGFDRIIYDTQNNVLKRVHYHERYECSRQQFAKLVPTNDAPALESIQWAFNAILKGCSLNQIAEELNHRGMTTRAGQPWKRFTVVRLLKNPIYSARERIGSTASGKFTRITDEIILREMDHPPIVSVEVFEAVQQVLEKRTGTRTAGELGRYLLSSRVVCGNCGSQMSGHWRNYRENASRYTCSQRNGAPRRGERPCSVSISGERLEAAVLSAIQRYILTDANILAASAEHPDEHQTGENSPVAAMIEELNAKIETATDRLAGDALNDEEFAAVASKRRKWMAELKKLRRSLRPAQVVQSKSASLSLQEMRDHAQSLDMIDRQMLRDFCIACIDSVTVFRESKQVARVSLVFNPDCYGGAPIDITAEVNGAERGWRKVYSILTNAGRPMRWTELVNQAGCHPANLHRMVQLGIREGMIRKGDTRGIYAAIPQIR